MRDSSQDSDTFNIDPTEGVVFARWSFVDLCFILPGQRHLLVAADKIKTLDNLL